MKKITVLLCLLLPLLVVAQRDSILSGVIDWTEHLKSSQVAITSPILFEGAAHDMKWLQINGNDLYTDKKYTKLTQTKRTDSSECIMIVQSGKLMLQMRDSSYTLSPGSIILLMPGESYAIQALQKHCSYYTLEYNSRQPKDAERGRTAGGSQVINWDTVTLKPNAKGGRRDFLNRPTAMSRRVEIHASTLNQGLKSHDPHTHIAPEIVIVTEGKTEMQIGNRFYPGKSGSVYFLASNNLHAIQNKGSGDCTYFAIQLE